jgi:hypothetical protein
VAAAGASSESILIAGVAGLVAGAMSMVAGEYVSVSSQADTERADLDREREELAIDSEHEYAEMTAIYVGRGLDVGLGSDVAIIDPSGTSRLIPFNTRITLEYLTSILFSLSIAILFSCNARTHPWFEISRGGTLPPL